MFKKVLIANRGEIAVRVTKTLQEMGIKVVCIYSDADENSLHVEHADEAYPLVGNSSQETYLNIEKIINIAQAASVDAIHAGYGFLSENEQFAQACFDANIKFIGPSPAVIKAMGDKILAKRAMSGVNVPVIPGYSGDVSDIEEVRSAANKIGYSDTTQQEDVENKMLVQDMLQRLDGTARKIMECYYLEGQSQDDISKEMGISPMAVSRSLEASRSKLKALFSE